MIKFLNVLSSSLDEQLEIRKWRNEEEVRKYMYTSNVISEKEHLKWINLLKESNDIKVYYIIFENNKIGIASISKIDKTNKICDWAFYFNNNIKKGIGIGKIVEKEFVNYIFNNFDIEKLNCEVLSNNLKIVEMHKKFGFTLEGILRKNILKNNERLDIYKLGLLKEEWSNRYEKNKNNS